MNTLFKVAAVLVVASLVAGCFLRDLPKYL